MKQLNPGEAAPDFAINTIKGKRVRLKQFQGQLVWMILYRYAGCPLCNLHFGAVMRRKDKLRERGMQILTVFDSGIESFSNDLKAFSDPAIHLISNQGRELYDLYGAASRVSGLLSLTVAKDFVTALSQGYKQGKVTGKLGQLPAHFLINETGILHAAHYGSHIGDHISFEEVEEFASTGAGVWDWSVVS